MVSSSHLTNPSRDLYDIDFHAWTQEQVKLLRDKKWNYLDSENLIEEIESLGRQEQQELENRLSILLGHLLKWEYQPSQRSKSWFSTIREQRFRILRLLKRSPSLKPYIDEAVEAAYEDGLELAVRETSLGYSAFPNKCLYEYEQIRDFEFLPGESFEMPEAWK